MKLLRFEEYDAKKEREKEIVDDVENVLSNLLETNETPERNFNLHLQMRTRCCIDIDTLFLLLLLQRSLHFHAT